MSDTTLNGLPDVEGDRESREERKVSRESSRSASSPAEPPETAEPVFVVPFRCSNDQCELNEKNQYTHPSDGSCGSCGEPMTKLVVTHHVYPDKEGEIRSRDPKTNREKRFTFGCEPAREAVKRSKKASDHPKSYTGDEAAVTCFNCLQRLGYTIGEDDLLVPPEKESDDPTSLVN